MVKFTGIGNVAGRTLWYASFEHFIADIPALIPRADYDCLVAQSFLHDEFISERKPKVYFSREPLEGLTEQTRRNVSRTDLAPFIVSFAEPDVDRRMFYVALPEDRQRDYPKARAFPDSQAIEALLHGQHLQDKRSPAPAAGTHPVRKGMGN